MKMIDIIISDELRNVLLEIKDSKVAELLLRGSHSENTLVENPVNYISISKKDLTKISYLPKERYDGLSVDECWLTTKRIMAKPGGFISKVFIDISEKEVEKFSTLFRNEVTKPKLDFKVVSGDDIKKYYHYTSYSERGGGSLNASCMKYDNCQDFLKLYTSNPEICKMVVLYDDEYQNRILGRALLWEFNGNKIMDRIYTINDEDYQFYFKQWATKNGYLFKTQQNWFNTKYFEILGDKKQKLELSLDLKNKSFDYVPYMDTFKFMDYNGILYNYQPEGRDFYTLTDTGGRKNGYDHLVTDFLDDVLRYRGEAIRLDYLGKNKWTHPDNCKYSDVMDRYILKDHCVKEPTLNDWIFNEEYSSNNDEQRIKERIELVKQREEERRLRSEQRKKSRSSSYDEYSNTIYTEGIRFRFGEMINQYIDPQPVEQETQDDLRVFEDDTVEETTQPVRTTYHYSNGTDTMREDTTTATQTQRESSISSIRGYINSLIESGFIHTSDFRLPESTDQTEVLITSTESEPVVEIDFSSIPQPTQTDAMIDEQTTTDQSQSRTTRNCTYLRYGDLDYRYLEHLRRNSYSSVSPHGDGEMVRYIEDYIQHNYRNSGYREIDSQYVRYISENVSYKYTIGQISSLREIVEYIDYSLTPFRVEQVEPLPF